MPGESYRQLHASCLLHVCQPQSHVAWLCSLGAVYGAITTCVLSTCIHDCQQQAHEHGAQVLLTWLLCVQHNTDSLEWHKSR